MAKYSIEITSYAPVDSVEHVLENVNWIKNAVKEAGYNAEKYVFESNFDIGELSCTCESEEELRTEALGQEVVFFNASLNFFFGKNHIGFILNKSDSINEGKNVFISCNDKTMLSCIVSKLKHQEKKQLDSQTSSVVVHAEGASSSNIVIGSGNTASINTASQPAPKSFWKDIWAGILKNIIWVVVAAIILAALAYLGITQPDWLKL